MIAPRLGSSRPFGSVLIVSTPSFIGPTKRRTAVCGGRVRSHYESPCRRSGMNVTLWIIAGLLAAAFLAGGAVKLVSPKEKLAGAGMGFAEDFSPGAVKAIGTLEILAGI